MSIKSAYRLCEGVQVRPEKFGLLFYQYAGPKLYFVPSQDLVDVSFFHGEQTFDNAVDVIGDRGGWPEETAEQYLSMLLKLLKSKGLVHEQPVC